MMFGDLTNAALDFLTGGRAPWQGAPDSSAPSNAKLIDEGWTPYRHFPPSRSAHSKVWLHRVGWEAPVLCQLSDMDPMMNVYGLYWRPADAGTEITTSYRGT